MGHAIGTHYHEPPWIDLLENTELRENMVLVLEPILRKKGVGGVLIEDAVLVTAEGGERLSNLDIRPWRSILS
jgi:Xaa-Pro aminopeptidase